MRYLNSDGKVIKEKEYKQLGAGVVKNSYSMRVSVTKNKGRKFFYIRNEKGRILTREKGSTWGKFGHTRYMFILKGGKLERTQRIKRLDGKSKQFEKPVYQIAKRPNKGTKFRKKDNAYKVKSSYGSLPSVEGHIYMVVMFYKGSSTVYKDGNSSWFNIRSASERHEATREAFSQCWAQIDFSPDGYVIVEESVVYNTGGHTSHKR